MNRNRQEKGITLIALVITIIVLLILAGVSITTLTGESGILNNAQKAAFKTNVAKYKEQIALNRFDLQEDNSIKGLKQQLELQKGALEQAQQNCQKAIEFVQKAELNMEDLLEILSRIDPLLRKIDDNFITSTDLENLKGEIEQLILEYDRIVRETEIDGKILLNGSINENNPYIVDFGSRYFQQGKMIITIHDLSWDNLHGTREIDYSNISGEIEKIRGSIEGVSCERCVVVAYQNALDCASAWFSNQKVNLEKLYQNIFGINEEIGGEQAIKNAESWGTTIEFISIIDYTCGNVDGRLDRIKEIISYAKTNIESVDVEGYQLEISGQIKEIDRELTYTQAGNKKLLDGSFPYIEKITLETLGIQEISIMTEEEIANSETKITGAKQKLANLQEEITKKQTELGSKQEQKADKGYAFEIDNTTARPMVEIEEKDKDKFQIVNGELTYIGNNQNEKQWALEMDIQVKNN